MMGRQTDAVAIASIRIINSGSIGFERRLCKEVERGSGAGVHGRGPVKGEGFAIDAGVMEAYASRYHGKAPDEIDWSAPEARRARLPSSLGV
jgi:hypothetical protein